MRSVTKEGKKISVLYISKLKPTSHILRFPFSENIATISPSSKMILMIIILVAVLLIVVPEPNESGKVSLCIHNCAQCKRTFGPFFEGQRCAEWCIRIQGATLPDCSELDSIADFITKLE
ncbi:transposable element Tc3 transposase [Caerostris darwini]|uniref:Transposable element Tc3 transposase n=1 Tax=Caerostris darwini TaxID=1538125 RepID=A0AAV4Q7H6_9ARAC|nr:transposable element Tc3 transposase [Caerostris darwini]